jgi:cobalamin synthase
MGIIVLVLTLILKWSLLVTLIRAEWWTVIVLMPMVGWVFAQMVMTGSRWVHHHESLPHGWRNQVELSWLWPQWLLLLMALALASGWTLTLLILTTWMYIVWWRKKIGGVNYVVSLAWVELSELIWLMGLVWLLLPA